MAAGASGSTIDVNPVLYFEDLGVGQRASLARTVFEGDLAMPLSVQAGEAAAAASRGAGQGAFGQRIAHGMFTAGLVSTVLGTKLPGPGAVYLSQSIQFLAPVSIGDLVTANVEVVELIPSRKRARLFCECVCAGRTVLEGEAWVAVESRAAGHA
jgi:3-hydroxybutyryl-CoA dehydratase